MPRTLFAHKGYTHGVVVFNSIHAVAALTGVPLRDLLRDRHARLLWAAMIREGLQVRTPQLERLMPGTLRGPRRRRGWHCVKGMALGLAALASERVARVGGMKEEERVRA